MGQSNAVYQPQKFHKFHCMAWAVFSVKLQRIEFCHTRKQARIVCKGWRTRRNIKDAKVHRVSVLDEGVAR